MNMFTSRRSVLSLPEEITMNILLRLPLKTLGQCRCVCKPWCSLISTQYFAKLQLHRTISDSNTDHFRLFTISSPFHSLDYESPSSFENVDDDGAVMDLGYPSMKIPETSVEIVGSCNGLICLFYSPDCFILWNPTNKVSLQLPKLPGFSSDHTFSFLGLELGHDSFSDDYNVVVAASSAATANELNFHVFSLESGSWRTINGPHNLISIFQIVGTFFNGAIHWQASHGTGENQCEVVVSFDLAEEKFGEISQPVIKERGFSFNSLSVFEGSLYLISFGNTEIEIWRLMKECGRDVSWTRLANLPAVEFEYCAYLSPVCLTKNGDLVVDVDGRSLVRCNLKENTSRNLLRVAAMIGLNGLFMWRASFHRELVDECTYLFGTKCGT